MGGQAMENLDILLDYRRDFQGVTGSGNFKMWGPLMIYIFYVYCNVKIFTSIEYFPIEIVAVIVRVEYNFIRSKRLPIE